MTEPDASTAEPADEGSLSNDDIYDFLADKRRRYALHYLKQVDDRITVRDLAEQVAAWENDTSVAELTSQERKRVYIALYQSHLPSLHRAGLVDYDDDRGTVALTDRLEQVDIYMEVVPRADVPWSLYYVGLTTANAVLLALGWFGVAPFDRIPHIWWAVVVLVTFGVSAFVQLYSSRRMRFGDEGPPPELTNR